jgi:hypothetical protein
MRAILNAVLEFLAWGMRPNVTNIALNSQSLVFRLHQEISNTTQARFISAFGISCPRTRYINPANTAMSAPPLQALTREAQGVLPQLGKLAFRPSSNLSSTQSFSKMPVANSLGKGSRPADLEVSWTESKTDGSVMAYDLQSVAASQTSRFSISAASASQKGPKSQNVHDGRSRQPRRKTPLVDRGPEEFEYHFHETPLGLTESYFADSQQHHCTFASRTTTGRVLSESSEAPDSDSSNDDATVFDRNSAVFSTDARREKKVKIGAISRISRAISLPSDNHETHNKTVEDSESLSPETHQPTNIGDNGEEADKAEGAEDVVQNKKLPYVSDDDLFKDRWFPDPWDRPPGQMWTKPVQDQHNLRAAIRDRGFSGPRAAWLFSQLQKRKGTRFPYLEKTSVLKKSEQTPAEYLRALKRRKAEKRAWKNQVREYDEEGTLEEIKWTLGLYEMIYGPDWPNDAAKAATNMPETAIDRSKTIDNTDEEPPAKRRRIAQQTPETGRSRTTIASAVVEGITDPGPNQRAPRQEVEESNRKFNTHKAKVLEAARKEREEAEVRAFIYSAQNRKFSNGYRESWK